MNQLKFGRRPNGRLAASWPIIRIPHNGLHCLFGQLHHDVQNSSPFSATYITANTAVAYPFYVWEPTTVYKMGWVNGSAAGGNTDVAIYNSAWSRLTSAGSTAGSGNSVPQWVNTADVNLDPGTLYYAAVNHSAVTANQLAGLGDTSSRLRWQLMCGIKVQAVGATALPATFTPSDPAAAVMCPVILLSTVSGIV